MSEVTAETVDRELLKLTLRFKSDLEAYAQACLTIRGTDKIARRLIFNRAQQHIHAQLEAQKKATGKVRALILKGRQQGCSTYVGARYYHQATHGQGARVYILRNEHGHPEPVRHRQALSRQLSETGCVHRSAMPAPRSCSSTSSTPATKSGRPRRRARGARPRSNTFTVPNARSGRMRTITSPACCRPCPMRLAADHPREHGQRRWGHLPQHVARCGDARKRVYRRSSYPGTGRTNMRDLFPPASRWTEEEQTYARLYGLSPERMAWRRIKIAELRDPALFKKEYRQTPPRPSSRRGTIPSSAGSDCQCRKATHEPSGPLIIGFDRPGRVTRGTRWLSVAGAS